MSSRITRISLAMTPTGSPESDFRSIANTPSRRPSPTGGWGPLRRPHKPRPALRPPSVPDSRKIAQTGTTLARDVFRRREGRAETDGKSYGQPWNLFWIGSVHPIFGGLSRPLGCPPFSVRRENTAAGHAGDV